jgi:hypothetical protein
MEEYSFTRREAEYVMRYKTEIAISVPTVWEDTDIDFYRSLLADAGYPSTTLILSEAKNAALFKIVWELTSYGTEVGTEEELKRKANKFEKEWKDVLMIGIDIGHGTADLTTLQVGGARPFVRLREVVAGIGSHCVAYQLNVLFKQRFQNQYPQKLDDLSRKYNLPKSTILESLSSGFEQTKTRLDAGRQYFNVMYKLPDRRANGEGYGVSGQIRLIQADMDWIFGR